MNNSVNAAILCGSIYLMIREYYLNLSLYYPTLMTFFCIHMRSKQEDAMKEHLNFMMTKLMEVRSSENYGHLSFYSNLI